MKLLDGLQCVGGEDEAGRREQPGRHGKIYVSAIFVGSLGFQQIAKAQTEW